MTGILTLMVLGPSLSVDAFAAAIGKGATGRRPRFLDALRIGAVFGAFEALTPAIGWAIGLALASWIRAVDHWVAFGLLVAVGGTCCGKRPSRRRRAKPRMERLPVTAY